jgi:hypothetical protein
VPAVTKGLKRARDESTSDDDEWHQGWRQLGDDNQWKQFDDYWRKHEITGDSPSITLSYEERVEEDPKYRLPLAPETKDRITVHECYKSFYGLWHVSGVRYSRRNLYFASETCQRPRPCPHWTARNWCVVIMTACHVTLTVISNQERRCGYRTRSFDFSLRMKQSSTILAVGHPFSLGIPSILVLRG